MKPIDLGPLMAPRSVAVVGASQRGGRATGAIRNLIDLGFTGKIYPVNPNYETVMDLPCYPSLEAIPGPVDLVAIGIPSERIMAVLEDAERKGVAAAVIFAAGFGEAGETGLERQAAITALIERSGMAICGPNCLGVINLHDRSCGYSSTTPKAVLSGDVGVLAQSGSVVVALVRTARPIGFSWIVSSGNEAGATGADYLAYMVEDPKTRVLAAFMEGIKRPERFIEVADRAWALAKPLLVVKTGASALGRAATAAHTGSLAGAHEVQRALFRQKGIVQCDDLDEWMEAIELFSRGKPPPANGIGVIGISGGENALVMDVATELGLQVPPLSPAGRARLAALLPWFARPENPIDPTGAMGDNPKIFNQCLEILAEEPEIGVIAISQDSPAVFDVIVAQGAAAVAPGIAKPIVYFNNFSGPIRPEVIDPLRGAGIPYLQGLRESLKAIKAFIDYHRRRRDPPSPPLVRRDESRRMAALRQLGHGPGFLTEDASKALLARYDLPMVRDIVARSPEAALEAGRALGYPVAAKLISPDVAHKAAIGGVRLDLRSADELGRAYDAILDAARRHRPEARIEGVLVQPMLRGGIEVILGLKRDPQFGSTIVIGLGGILVEAIRQVALRVAPLGVDDARAMIAELPALQRMAEKLQPGFDAAAMLVPLLLRLSDLALELGDRVAAIDINPLLLDPVAGTAVAVDALIERGLGEAA
jgi:acyl-CoA synthetase (NDP forming)